MKKVTDLTEKEVIHCKTEEEANAICKLMHEAGLTWCDFDSYLRKTCYSNYTSDTCYEPKTGSFASLL